MAVAQNYATGPSSNPFGNYDAADIARSNQAGMQDAAIAGGISAIGSLAQVGVSAIDTAQDRENKKRLAELARRKGLKEGERAEIDEQAMRGVRTFAAEAQNRNDNALAASGTHSAGALSQARRDNMRSVNDAAIKAADIGIRENRAQVQRDVQEEQERIAYKSEAARERLAYAGQAIAGLGKVLAPVMASNPAASAPTDAQFDAMRAARNPDGSAMYPGLGDMDNEMARADWLARYKAARPGAKDPFAR